MKLISTFLLTVLLVASAVSQRPASNPKPRATIEGIVTKDPGGEPVKKALIELIAEDQTTAGDYTAISGTDGVFRVEGILPGRYRLFAERTGFLEFEKRHPRSEGRVLTLGEGQELKGLQIRLQAAALVRGRVTDEDGDPLLNAQVSVMRQTFAAGHNRFEQVGSERTNDLGEYRIASLPAGNYFVSVTPPPDFKNLIENSGTAVPQRESKTGDSKPDKPTLSYQTTYYPGTQDRSQASPIQLHPGDEFPVNFSLTPGPTLSIRGSVVNLPPRSTAVIMLQSRDFNLVLNGAEMHKDGSFEIRDVAPGAYTLMASVENGPMPMMAKQSLQVAGSSVEGLRLSPQPGGSIRGRLRFESKGTVARFDPTQIFLALQSADGDDNALGTFGMGDGFSHVTHVAADGSFEWKNVPPGTFYIQFIDGTSSSDWYMKSALAGGRDVNESGISVDGGAMMLDLLVSSNGPAVEGTASDQKGQPVANAAVVAVPELRLRSREDRFFKTATDQSGHFVLRALPPGEYTLFAWESLDGDSYLDPNLLKNYQSQGSALHLGEGERKTVPLQVIPDPADPATQP
jgi:hypothetical protein